MATEVIMHNGMEMEERTEAKFFKFETPGQFVEGVLVGIDVAMVGDPRLKDDPKQFEKSKRKTTKFTLKTEDGKTSILGTYDIVSKLDMEDKGKFVQITYEGEDKTVTRNGNALRRFRVRVSKKPLITGKALEEASLEITDDDIPF